MTSSEDVLAFWFGAGPKDEPPRPTRMELWFGGSEQTDREIRDRFGDDVERARRGELNDWAKTARGRLALIVLLDQFSRNLYRGSAEAFANDALSLKLTLEGLESRQDEELSCVEQHFFLLPLEHCEDLAMQERMVIYLDAWATRAPEALKSMAEGACDFARLHRNVIAKFGRFPTRNQALGRASTPEEEAHVRQAKAAGRPV